MSDGGRFVIARCCCYIVLPAMSRSKKSAILVYTYIHIEKNAQMFLLLLSSTVRTQQLGTILQLF